jgi:pyrroline-5-carboxylate reductase
MRIAFIGGGTMAGAVISAVLSHNVAGPNDIIAGEPLPERRDALRERHKIAVTADNREAVNGARVIVLAVKPHQLAAAAVDLKGRLSPDQTVLSIMAGVTVATLQASLDHAAVVRAMPNTPAQVGEGMCAWTAAPEVKPRARDQARQVLAATGKEVYFEDEKYIDMATAVSGSGPGFLFLLMEAFIDGAVHLGLPRETAGEMVIQTFLGSARLAQETGRPVAELRSLVTTPGGTTAEGLLALESAGVRAAIAEALIAAYEKAQSLRGGKPRQ